MSPMGRPRIVATPEEFDQLVDGYAAKCATTGEPVTFTGMAIALGFADRRSFYDYEKHADFSRSVKSARALVEHEYEKRLSGNNVAGAIFALKNHGWSDRQDVAHSGSIQTGVLAVPPELGEEEWASQIMAARGAASGNGSGG